MTDQPTPPPPAEPPLDDYLHTFTPVPTRLRRDGWTPEKQRAFIAHLRQHGSVHKAAKTVGMSHQSAWRLRNHPKAGEFAVAWERAMDEARSDALDRALQVLKHGVLIPRTYRGRYTGIVHRFDNRLAMAALRDPARPPGR
jgi:hypothetical protein